MPRSRLFVVESDDEEVISKKTKLNDGKGSAYKPDLDFDNYGFGKRVKRKNALFKNYKLDSDSDSDFEAGKNRGKRGKSQKKYNPRNNDSTKLELLLSWKRDLKISEPTENNDSYKMIKTKNILESDLKSYGHDLQALFINIKWKTAYDSDGIKIDEFKKIDLNKRLMKNGIVFIWSEKELLGKLLKIMEEKNFFYIENLAICLLDANKRLDEKNKVSVASETETLKAGDKPKSVNSPDHSETSTTDSNKPVKPKDKEPEIKNEEFLSEIHKINNVDPSALFFEGDGQYIKKTKQTLMMFRRNEGDTLELRHQRTCDALFDLVDQEDARNTDTKTKEYIYKLIETLLPKALYDPETPKAHLKMMELWADEERPREGWISICEAE